MSESQDKVAVITGAAQGLGYAIADRLSRQARCILIDTSPKVEAAARALPGAIGLVADVGDEASIADAFDRIARDYGRLDILVNNAGIHPRTETGDLTALDRVTLADWDYVLRINLTGMFIVTKAALPLMRARGWGRIVNMSSLAARNGGGDGAVAYAASKGAIIAYTRGLAKEVAGKGITVNGLAPGLILETPFHENFNTDAGIQGAINATPLKRGGTPADVAGAVVYFVSELGAFITGEIIEINGGLYFA